jgi:hypothetical protein
MQKAGDQVF